jgi:hypothetical protein
MISGCWQTLDYVVTPCLQANLNRSCGKLQEEYDVLLYGGMLEWLSTTTRSEFLKFSPPDVFEKKENGVLFFSTKDCLRADKSTCFLEGHEYYKVRRAACGSIRLPCIPYIYGKIKIVINLEVASRLKAAQHAGAVLLVWVSLRDKRKLVLCCCVQVTHSGIDPMMQRYLQECKLLQRDNDTDVHPHNSR